MFDIKKHLDALTAARWDDYKATLANDVIYEEIASHVRAKGANDCVEHVQRWKRAFPDLAATVTSTFATGDRVVAEVEWEGTHKGALEGPLGTIAPTNKRGMIKAVLVATIKNDRIAELHHYFDMMTLLATLGVAPTIGASAAKAPAGAPVQRH